MICPHCRAEYVDGVESCLDCGSLLVGELSPSVEATRSDDDSELVELLSTTDATLIPVVVGLLQSAEIPSVVRGADSAGLDLAVGRVASLFRVRAPGVRVLVARCDLEAARELLEGEPELPGEPEEDEPESS